ncbi:MAG: pyruvate formate lyase family protein [Myxococcota bacterium]
MSLHPANEALRRRLLEAEHWLCTERARHYTASHRETEGEHPSLRAAKAARRIFAEMTLRLEPEELLVGNRSSKPIAPPLALERGDFSFVFEHLFPALERFGYRIEPAARAELFDELLPYWKGRTVRAEKLAALAAHGLSSPLDLSPRAFARRLRAFGLPALAKLLPKGVPLRSLFGALRAGAGDNVKGRGRCTDTQAHIVVGHRRVLAQGFRGLRDAARARKARGVDDDQRAFLEAVELVCEAMRDFAGRFAALARAQAETTPAARRAELLAIAERCERVPWLPPRSFEEAVQALWFTQNAAIITYGAGSGITPGRVDQLLWPFYEADRARGVLSEAHARRLVEELIIKLNDNVIIWPNLGGVELNHLGSDVENVTLGGVDARGEDATNELSYLFCDAIEHTRLATTASFRVSKQSPRAWVRRVAEMHRATNSPAFLCDETAIATLVRDGYALEDARDYCLVGCVEPSGHGDTGGATGGTKVYFPTALDLVFSRGRTSFFGHRDGPDTGDVRGFTSFEELLAAFYRQLEVMVDHVTAATDLRDDVWARRFHHPLISTTIDGCIEHGRDLTRGGARYNFSAVGGGGLATAVDSLSAIRAFVFERREVSMDRLARALATDFRHDEALRQTLASAAKFGNDDARVDALAAEVVARFCAHVSTHRTATGGRYKASLISYGLNVYEGALEPASADGRRAGAPLSNSMSPSNGAERRGPTAAMRSLARIDQTAIGYGNSLNMRLPLGLLSSEAGVESVVHLVRGYFAQGGFHVQFNAVDGETLRAAQARPAEFTDLIVRVSGYSAYFTRLGRSIQDDLIARTEFAAC